MSDYLPAWQDQGPADRCVIDGIKLGWLSCSAYGAAVGEDRATKGKRVRTGCDVRDRVRPVDLSGGLTWPQVARVQEADGVDVELHVGRRVCTPEYAGDQLHANRSFGLQGNTGALIGEDEQSTNGPVNHFVHVNHGRGWKLVNGHWRPLEAYVYDSAANGRRMMAQGPQWWPWARVLAFAAALEPNGEGTGRLGPGKLYAGFYDPVPPSGTFLVLKYGAVKTKPYPDRQRADVPAGKVARTWSRPSFQAKTVRRLHKGDLFVAYQKTTKGQRLHGSSTWYGNKAGSEWIHSSRVNHEGGST